MSDSPTPEPGDKPRLGLALGSGAALGLAHVGVIRALEESGLVPDVVAGTSIGGVVGAAYVLGVLDRLEAAARNVGWLEVLRLARIGIGTGSLLNGEAIEKEMRNYVGEVPFAGASRPFAVVACDIERNEAVTLRSGSVASALRASIAIPGIFAPVRREGRLLADGGLKNPVPVSVCRDLGATHVIAVDVTGDYAGQVAAMGIAEGNDPGLYEVATLAFSIIMNAVAEANYRLYPADALVVPKIGHVKPYDFGEGGTLIEAGRKAALEALPDIHAMLDKPASMKTVGTAG